MKSLQTFTVDYSVELVMISIWTQILDIYSKTCIYVITKSVICDELSKQIGSRALK